MKKLISILSVILLVVAFSVPCASEDGAGPGAPAKIQMKRKIGHYNEGPASSQNASLESSSVKDTAEAPDPTQNKRKVQPKPQPKSWQGEGQGGNPD
jgi:hypothetical protein